MNQRALILQRMDTASQERKVKSRFKDREYQTGPSIVGRYARKTPGKRCMGDNKENNPNEKYLKTICAEKIGSD